MTVTDKKGTESASGRRGRPAGTGGARLATAFDEVTKLPALAEATRRLMRAADREAASSAEIAQAIESDAGLAIAIMRAANNGQGPPGRCGGVNEAVDSLSTLGVKTIVAGLETYDNFDIPSAAAERYERFRRHAVAVRQASDRIADVARVTKRDELAVAALLHDVGRLVMLELYGEEYEALVQGESPDERVRRERRDLGIDHALVGAVLVRRWGLVPGIATAVERHHSDEASDHSAVIRLADSIVHFVEGDPVSSEALLAAARPLDITPDRLRSLVYEYPYAGDSPRRSADPCPLSARELDALQGLADGKVYKQIAQELSLSVSTIRTHLHNVYRKIGAVDRAQAVLMARERNWI
jgi:putative nucleotidyltransferase with HDIG domain